MEFASLAHTVTSTQSSSPDRHCYLQKVYFYKPRDLRLRKQSAQLTFTRYLAYFFAKACLV